MIGGFRRAAGAGLLSILPLSVSLGRCEEALPRTILALVDSGDQPDLTSCLIHRRAELALNHLGLVLRYHDIRDGLPSLGELDDVRGVLSWFQAPLTVSPDAYSNWLSELIGSGKKVVILGELGPPETVAGQVSPARNRIWKLLGLGAEGQWVNMTYDLEITYKDPLVVEFERPLSGVLPPYPVLRVVDPAARSFLTVRRAVDAASTSDLVVAGPHGGYVAAGYLLYAPFPKTAQWYLNPFEFFRRAFATDDLPKPDVNTLSGRRIFYSHIDGDGWRNTSEVPGYRRKRSRAAEVILKEVLEPFSDLPVTVAPIAADLDPNWHGSESALELARRIFALPHVDAGSHTYSHPLDWSYFAPDRASRDDREPLATKVRSGLWNEWHWLQDWLGLEGRGIYGDGDSGRPNGQDRPRAYLRHPFRLETEIGGAVDFIESLLPPGKKVEVVQWTGDTKPFPKAIAETRRIGLRNINGGDSRFDQEFPSYLWVSPVGLAQGGERQIYASNSNENTYTELWTNRYFGFKYLVKTIRSTETPRRVKPCNVYYHLYSGEKLASLRAVQQNLRAAREEELAPISTAHYAAIADGFFTARLVQLGERIWRIENRDNLQTVRFDRAAFQAVDFSRSHGVIGQRHYQGSLYVGLDSTVDRPVIALYDHAETDELPVADRAYLVEARWLVSDLRVAGREFTFLAQGFGRGDMTWRVSTPGRYSVKVERGGVTVGSTQARAGSDGALHLVVSEPAIEPLRIAVRRIS